MPELGFLTEMAVSGTWDPIVGSYTKALELGSVHLFVYLHIYLYYMLYVYT